MLVCPNCGSNILYGVGLIPDFPLMVKCSWCDNFWMDKNVIKGTFTRLALLAFYANLQRVFWEIDMKKLEGDRKCD